MKYSILSSSSSGNSVYLEINNKKFLLDCGISFRQIQLKLDSLGVKLDSLDGIFITHEHADHISGLCGVLNRIKTSIYMSKGTYRGLPQNIKDKISPIYFKFITIEKEFNIDDINILPFKTSHDAMDSNGYKFTFDGKKLVYLTDTGVFQYRDDLANADSYILECNHEPEMLMLSNRPWHLINRIMSNYGHLSNEASAKIFSELKGDKTKTLCLYHLSNECNTKELALLSYESYFRKNNLSIDSINIIVSSSKNSTDFIEV